MGDRGSVLPVLVLLVVGGAMAVALTIEVGCAGASWREASFAADAGAEAGAAALDADAAYAGRLQLNPALAEQAAVAAALAARPRDGRTASAHADTEQVCVTVSQPLPAGFLAPFVPEGVIRVSACASPAQG
jgi:hypothetical protein